MNCAYRKYMDTGNPLYLNKTPKQILSELGVRADTKKTSVNNMMNLFLNGWRISILTCSGNIT